MSFILNLLGRPAEKVRDDDRKVLVHCQSGINRSPSVVVGYLMKFCGHDLATAAEIVVTKCGVLVL